MKKHPTFQPLLVAYVLLAAAAQAQQVKPYAELIRLFDYDLKSPPEIQQMALAEREGIKVLDLSFASPRGGRTGAYLVVPPGKGPFAATIFAHAGGRVNFLPDALLLARAGAVSMLLDLPFGGDAMATSMERAIVDIRRSVDLLVARVEVDPKRIGYVGHSYGAMMGAVVAGVDKRVKCFVLEVGLLGMSYHLRNSQHPWPVQVRTQTPKDEFEKLMASIVPYDAVHYIAHAAPAALLFQSARFDIGVAEQESLDFYRTASGPKELRWYDTGHEANDIEAVFDRAKFLEKHLSLRPVEPVVRKKLGFKNR